MKQRLRIPKEIIRKFVEAMCFMMETDSTCMKAIEPRIQWIPSMGYEVDPFIVVQHVDVILAPKKDPNIE